MNAKETSLAGDAICSYGVLDRASRVLHGKNSPLQDVPSLFAKDRGPELRASSCLVRAVTGNHVETL